MQALNKPRPNIPGGEILDKNEVNVILFEGFDKADLKGATVIGGFPSIGLVSTIAANYLIDVLGLRHIGILDCRDFPALAVVHDSEPLAPVRVYAGKKCQKKKSAECVVVFVSEFQPAQQLMRPISDAVMDFVKQNGCDLMISPEGIVLEGALSEDEVVDVFAIGSTEKARGLLTEKGIKQFSNGIIAGISGLTLTRGKREGIDAISMLAEANPDFPDARGAAAIIETIANLIDLDIDVGPLYDEAERIEKQLMAVQAQAKPITERKTLQSGPQMYA